eukprot:GHVS01024206.1.p1 GENE.GHVS01024206.1~~GHVS01024206.1.p1  ORF type:complete len:272 (+),score=37.78 GHVS01024206.1:97-912(+)
MNLSRPIMLLLPLVAIVLFAIQPGFCMKEGDAVVATAEDKVDATSNEGQVRRIKTGIEESMVPTQQSMVPTQQKENEKLENLRNQYEKRTEAIRTAINKLEEEMKTLTIERERNEHKIEQLTEELRDEIENLQQEIGNLERSADRLTAELADIFTPYSVRHSADTEALIKLQAMYAEATESTKIKLEKRDEIENLQQQATADLQKAETKLQVSLLWPYRHHTGSFICNLVDDILENDGCSIQPLCFKQLVLRSSQLFIAPASSFCCSRVVA